MNAQRLPIVEPAATPPQYDNVYLGWESDWIISNMPALLCWWDTLGGVAFSTPQEFPSFARSQHDIELTRRDEHRNTFRQGDE